MSDFYNYMSLAEHLVPIFISFYLGSWSDHWGRKPFIFLSMTGMLFSAGMNLINVVYLREWSKWVWLGSVIFIKNAFGGHLCFVMVAYSFIADNSTDEYASFDNQAADYKTSNYKLYFAHDPTSRWSYWCLAS